MKSGKKPEVEQKRAGKIAPISKTSSTFGMLLKWHLARGTRAGSDLSKQGIPWTRKSFGDAVRSPRSAARFKVSVDRSVRNWCNGSSLPHDLTYIEAALFGAAPVPPAEDVAHLFRQELREAFHRAKHPEAAGYQVSRERWQADSIPIPGKCFGRELEQAKAVRAILSKTSEGSVLIIGNAGHGKTMLAQVVGSHPEVVRSFGERRFIIELECSDSAELATQEIAKAFGLEPTAAFSSIQARLERFEKPVLLVLDNLETPLQAHGQRQATEQLLSRLDRISGLALIATYRSHETVAAIDWSEVIFLENLHAEDARELFLATARTISPPDPDLDYFVGDTGVLGGIPLAIRLVAHRVLSQRNLRAMRSDWQRHGALLASLPAAENTRNDSLLASIEFSLESNRLQAPGKALFSICGQLPAGLEIEDCALLLEKAAEAIAQLRSVGLLRDMGGNRIGLLPPIRDIAYRLHPPEPELSARWVTYFLDLVSTQGKLVGHAEGKAAVQRLLPEMSNITAAFASAIAQTELMEAVSNALEGLERALRFTGYRADTMLGELEALFRTRGGPLGLARCLYTKASGARIRSENASAVPQLEEAVRLLSELAEPALRGQCLYFLGDIARMQDRHSDAGAYFEKGRLQFQLARHAAGEGNCLFGIAEILRMREMHRAAGEAYEQAAGFYRVAGTVVGEAECLVGIADMARTRDDHLSAEANFAAALNLYRRAGWRPGEADSLWGLACAATTKLDYDKAGALFKLALNLHLDHGTAIGCGNCYWGLGELARYQAQSEEAANFYTKAIERFRVAAWPGGVAMGELGLAKVTLADPAVAAELFTTALQAFKEAGMLLDEADCMLGLASLQVGSTAAEFCDAARLLYMRAESPNGIRRCDTMLADLSGSRKDGEVNANIATSKDAAE